MERERLLTPADVARILRVPVNTLAYFRQKHKQLRYVKVGEAARYRKEDVIAYIEANVVTPQKTIMEG